jgi:hypothetical protein
MDNLNAREPQFANCAPDIQSNSGDIVQNDQVWLHHRDNVGKESFIRRMKEVLRMPQQLSKKAMMLAHGVGTRKPSIMTMHPRPKIFLRLAAAVVTGREWGSLACGPKKMHIMPSLD